MQLKTCTHRLFQDTLKADPQQEEGDNDTLEWLHYSYERVTQADSDYTLIDIIKLIIIDVS